MAKPWEDTIVMALRDTQWMVEGGADVSAPRLPRLFIKFDGPTEQTLGDLAFQEGERFYLFEVKSSSEGIKSEWNKVVKGEPRRKRAFDTLTKLTRAANAQHCSAEIAQAFWTSLRCHHFIYWSDEMFDSSDTFGNIMVEPYISGCIRLGAGKGGDATAMPIAVSPFETAQDDGNGEFLVGPMLPFSAIRQQNGFVTILEDDGKVDINRIAPVGEDLNRFRAYLRFLVETGGVGDGQIHAVLCSDKSGFVKVITSIEQLGAELKSSGAKPAATSGHLQRKSAPIPPGLTNVLEGYAPEGRPDFPNLNPPDPSPASHLRP